MNKYQFNAISEVATLCHNPVMQQGAFEVLVKGKAVVAVARKLGLQVPHLYAKCKRYRDLHDIINQAYGDL